MINIDIIFYQIRKALEVLQILIMESSLNQKKKKIAQSFHLKNPYRLRKVNLCPIRNDENIYNSKSLLKQKKSISCNLVINKSFIARNSNSLYKNKTNGSKKQEENQYQSIFEELKQLEEKKILTLSSDRIIVAKKKFLEVWGNYFLEKKNLKEKVNFFQNQEERVNIKMKEILKNNQDIIEGQPDDSYEISEFLDILDSLLLQYRLNLEKQKKFKADIESFAKKISHYQKLIEKQEKKLQYYIQRISDQSQYEQVVYKKLKGLESQLKQVLSEKDYQMLHLQINLKGCSAQLTQQVKNLAQNLELNPTLHPFSSFLYCTEQIRRDVRESFTIIENKQKKLHSFIGGMHRIITSSYPFIEDIFKKLYPQSQKQV